MVVTNAYLEKIRNDNPEAAEAVTKLLRAEINGVSMADLECNDAACDKCRLQTVCRF